jgi:hypothetical protein
MALHSIRDIIRPLPDKKDELADYILEHYSHIQKHLEDNPEHQGTLADAVNASFDKYSRYIGGQATKVSGAGHAVGYIADGWLLTGDIIGSLGGKFVHLLAQIPDKAHSIAYGVRTGNYLDAAKCILEGIVSYIPGLTVVDEGLTRIVQKRMIHDALTNFEKEVGIYKPWTQKVSDMLKPAYKDVKDRAKNVFSPDYEPESMLQPVYVRP